MLKVPLFTQSLHYVFGGVSAVIQEFIFCQSWPLLPSFFSLSIPSMCCTGYWLYLLWAQIPIWIVLVSPLMVSFKILGKNGFCFLLATAALRLVLNFCSFLFLVRVRPACHVAECPARKALLLLNKPTWLCFKTFCSLLIFLLPSMCTWWPNDFFGTLNNLWWWWLNFFAFFFFFLYLGFFP